MDYRFLGHTGLRVSTLGLGAMTFGGSGSAYFEGVGGVDATGAARMVDIAVDAGINLVDTADVYSRGLSEELLGQAVKGRRDKILIATKVHGRMSDDPNDLGQSRHHIISSCEASLRRLKVDHIDLYQIHGFDAYTRWEESLAAMDHLVRQGKVRYVGCSNLSAWQVMKAMWTADRRYLSSFVSLQANYSLLAREAEHELIPVCQDQGLGLLVWSPLAGGYLTGKYSGVEAGHGRRAAVGDPGTIDVQQASAVLKVMGEIAAAHGASMSQVALNYLIAKQAVTSVLVGAKTVEQFQDNIQCLSWTLGEEEHRALDEASDKPLPYPYWHQRRHNLARYSR